MDEHTSTALHNFSRASARDALAFASSRPGFPAEPSSSEQVAEWISFMKTKGIRRVLSLLGDDEKVDFFPSLDLDAEMTAAFGPECYTRTSVFTPGAHSVMSGALAAAKAANEPIVMHCAGGEGRAGLAMILWMVEVYGIAPEDAAREVAEEAERNLGVVRRPNAAKLAYLMEKGSMKGFGK